MPSNVIVFTTLFLGLVSGPREIEVAVSEPVASVEFLVDDAVVGVLRGEPWRLAHDFGPGLTTRELVAVAYDREGREIGRALELVNLPRSHVEIRLLLEDWVGGRPKMARIWWHSSQATEPLSSSIVLNGRLLEVSDLAHIELPDLNPRRLNFISAEVAFSNEERATAEAAFGGVYGSSVETELTAVPVIARERRLRSITDTSGWLREDGGAGLAIVAIEHGAANVAVVRDDAARPVLWHLDNHIRNRRDTGYWGLRLDRRDRLHLVSPRLSSEVEPAARYQLFPVSRAYGRQDAPVPTLLSRVSFVADPTRSQRLTDSVAIAGRFVAGSKGRRAVVAVVANCSDLSGQYSPEEVRGYLAQLRVPLAVWQTSPVRPDQKSSAWCEIAEEITTPKEYRRALQRLRSDLRAQQVVWVAGRHLLREIRLAGEARGVELVGD